MTLRLMKAFCTKTLPHEGHAPSMQSCQQQVYAAAQGATLQHICTQERWDHPKE